ncbi:hypothetical protein [Endozoicomonas sp. ALE010]|uniref:hypothetical protein n=1 Tax=Endozoicomonas sp. ALE010 TaxID=3403081 RepID=UPI003BB7FAF3
MSSIERGLYAQCRKGQSLASLKNKTIARYRIPARYFNAAKSSIEGKIRSVISNLANTEDSYQRRIWSKHRHIEKQTKTLNKEENPQKRAQLRFGQHQSKRRLSTLKARLLRIRQRLESNDPAICFGSKVLFKKQFHLEKNGYFGHSEWQQDWQEAWLKIGLWRSRSPLKNLKDSIGTESHSNSPATYEVSPLLICLGRITTSHQGCRAN